MSLSDVLKSLEEKLTFKKEATISGIKFGITLLTYEQDQLLNSFPDEGDDPLSFYEKTRTQVLSYAITQIDEDIIPAIVEVKVGDKTETKEKAIYVREIIKKLPPKIVEKLFEVYIDFKDEIDTQLNKDIEYKWYKTPEQRKAERDKKEKEDKEKESKDKVEDVAPVDTEESDLPEDKPLVYTKIDVKDDSIVQE